MGWIKWGLAGLAVSVALGAVAFGAFGGNAGMALAQVPGGPKDPGRYEELLAQKLGVTVEKLREAQLAVRDEMLAEAVKNGRLTQEQADKLKAAGANGNRGLFERDARMLKGPVMAGLRNAIGAAAEAIGITEQQLLEGLRAGKSIAEIAEENDVDRDDLEADILKSLTAAIDKAQADGNLTADQATKLKAGLQEHIDQALDHKGGEKRFRGMPGMMPPNMR